MKLIPLTQGKFAMVDDEDFENLNQWKWFAHNHKTTYYAERKEKGKIIAMHRYIMRTPHDMLTDHKDHDGTNNQKYNLRNCTKGENNCNRKARKDGVSKYLGVGKNQWSGRWNARIRKNKKLITIGTFDLEIDAAKAYDKMATEIHGDFANLNFK